jgi:hypothetical protein
VLNDVLRKYPEFIIDFIPFCSKIQIDQITEVEGKAAFVWILGHFGADIEESPYIIEKILDDKAELNSNKLQGALLTAVCKLFFIRSPEMKGIMVQIFENIVKFGSDPELKQRAIFYYRLMQEDI